MTIEIVKVSAATIVSALLFHLLQRKIRGEKKWKAFTALLVLKVVLTSLLSYFLLVFDSVVTWRFTFITGGFYMAILADLIRDILLLIFKLIRKKELFQKLSIVFSVLCTGAVLIYSVVNMQVVVPEHLTLSSDKLQTEHRFVFMADLHYGTAQRTETFDQTLRDIEALKPEFMLLGGDITDERTTKEEMQEVYAKLGKLDIPVYFIYGNHDRQNLHNAKSLTQVMTFAMNVDNIVMNHYAEINLAWLRTEDSFYDQVGLEANRKQMKEEKAFSLLDLLIPSAQAETVSGVSDSSDEPELIWIGDCGVVEITVEHGYSPVVALPDTVMAYYSDDTEKPVPIDWDWESTEWTYAEEFGQEWHSMEEYDASNPKPMWAAVNGFYGDASVQAEIYVTGIPEAEPPIASMFDLVYDQPISVELVSLGRGGTRIRYTLDGTDPRTSSTAQDYSEPLQLGSPDKKEDIFLLTYTVSDDPSQYNDSDVMVYHYGFSGLGVSPTVTPKPLPQTGDSANPALWLGLMLLGVIGLAVPAMAVFRKKKQ